MSDNDNYSIYSENYPEAQKKIYNLSWTFPDFRKTLENKTVREFRAQKNSSIDDDPGSEQKESNHGSEFEMKMIFSGRHNDLIEIFYRSPTSMFLQSELHIGQEKYIHEYQTIPANQWQYLATLYKRDVTDPQKIQKFRYYGQYTNTFDLQLKLKLIVFNDVRVDPLNVSTFQLSDDFGNLLNDASSSDVTVKSLEGEEFRVHKLVLAIRSEVLKSHFEHNTTECITNTIETPFETEVLRDVLTFVYTAKAPRVDDIPEKLLTAADYYQLGRLKSLCEVVLHKRLTVENAIDTLQLAELHSANSLKQSTLEFIKDGQANLITNTEGWAKLQSVKIIKIIYEFILADDIKADTINKV